MGKKSTLSVEQRTQPVLRLLSEEEPAAQIARRAGFSDQTLGSVARPGCSMDCLPGVERGE